MGHKIDMEKYEVRTDLAIELISDTTSKKYGDIKITNITLNEKDGKKINKKIKN